MKNKTFLIGLILAALFASTRSRAATSAEEVDLRATLPATKTSLSSMAFKIDWSSELHGDQIISSDPNFKANAGKDHGTKTVEHALFLGYQLNPHWIPGFNLVFDTNMGPDTGSRMPSSSQLKDPYFQIKGKKLISTPRWLAGGDVRAYLPFSEKSQEKGMLFGLRSGQSVSYSIDRVWTTGLRSMVRYNWFGEPGAAPSKKKPAKREDSTAFAKPYVSARVNEKVILELLYEMQVLHQLDRDFKEWATDVTTLQPGVYWEAVPGLNIRPYFAIQTNTTVSMASTFVGTDIKWDLL